MTFLGVASGTAVLAAAAALAAPAAVKTPRLAVTSTHPVTIRGTTFRMRERVRVVVTTGAGKGARYVRADRSGAFRVQFAKVTVSTCPWYIVRAVGSAGSRVTLRLLPECPNGPTD